MMWSDHTFLQSCTNGLSFGTKVWFFGFLLIELLFYLAQIFFDSEHIVQEMFVLPIYVLSSLTIIERFMFDHVFRSCSDNWCCSWGRKWIKCLKAITMIFDLILVVTTFREWEKWLSTNRFLTFRATDLTITGFRWNNRYQGAFVFLNKRRFLASDDFLDYIIWYHGGVLYAIDKA